MKGNNNSSYKTQLENQQIAAYPSNRNLRIKSDFLKPGKKQSKQYYQSTNIKNEPYRNNKFQHSIQPKRYKTYQFPSIQEQQQTKINRTKIKKSYMTIPYNTEEINRNVSKVLSDIQEIQSQFRKMSAQNSPLDKQLRYSQQQHQNKETKANMNSFLGSLMDKIKKPVNYQQKTDDYIKKQKTQLVSLVKNLNKKLNQRLKQVQQNQIKSNTRQTTTGSKLQGRRRIKTDIDVQESKKNQRSPSAMEFQKSLVQVAEQVNTNQKLIENMRHQLQFFNKKYQGYQNSLKNYKSTQHTVDGLKNMIKKKKQQISRLRKKKFLTQKSIISIQKRNGNLFSLNSTDILSTNCSTSTHPNNSLSSLKQQYSEYLKKRDKMKNKLQLNKMHLNRIQELKDKNNVNKQHYQELLEEIKRLNQIKEEQDGQGEYDKRYDKLERSRSPKSNKKLSQTQQQHLQFIYKTKRSKLQMLLNTIKRNDQSYKRKYYKLLKQYESIVEDHSDSATSSPSKNLSQSKVYKDSVEIVDEKLDKTRENILELENRIKRLGKIGKIVKKVNNNTYKNEDESYDDEQFQYENDEEYEMTQQSGSEKVIKNNSNNMYDRSFMKKDDSNSKSQTTPLNPHLNYQLYNLNSQSKNQRLITASSYIKTPDSELSLKDNAYRYDDRQSQFLTQNDRPFQQSTFGNDTSRPLSYNNLNNQQKKKYIGRFKKQRIVEKYSKMNQTNVDKNDEKFPPLLVRKHNKEDSKKKLLVSKNDVKQTIIEQQIQATNSLQSSQYKPKRSASNNRNQHNKSHWDQKILNLLKENDKQDDDIQQDIQQANQDDNNNFDQQEDYESSEFSPERQSEMLLLKQQTQKEQKEIQIKQKYSNILYKSRVFS